MGWYPKENYKRGEEWRKAHSSRYSGKCAKCGKEALKNTMPGIYLRKPNDSHRILCHLCSNCLPVLLADLGVEMPE